MSDRTSRNSFAKYFQSANQSDKHSIGEDLSGQKNVVENKFQQPGRFSMGRPQVSILKKSTVAQA